MSQNDLVIDNQSFPATRSDINSALQALGSLNSGSSAPATTYANMLWYDTTNNTLKMRSEANDQWISVGYLDQSADAFRIFDDTQVVNTSGTQTGLIGDQATSTWEAGTGTTESLVSPAKVKAAVEANVTPTLTGYLPFDIETSGDGLIYSHSADGNAASIETPTFESGYEYLVFMDDMRTTSSFLVNVAIAYYRVSGATYSSALSIGEAGDASGERFSAHIYLSAPDLSLEDRIFPIFRFNEGSFGSAVAGSTSSSDTISKVRFTCGSASFDNGKVWLFKRKFTV